jgi:hypothetical protein
MKSDPLIHGREHMHDPCSDFVIRRLAERVQEACRAKDQERALFLFDILMSRYHGRCSEHDVQVLDRIITSNEVST